MPESATSRRDFLRKPLKRFLPNDGCDTIENEPIDGEVQKDSENINDHTEDNAMMHDFTKDQLFFEIMKLGIDPSNLDEKQMLEILIEKMESRRKP